MIVVNPVGNKLTILRKVDLIWRIGLMRLACPAPVSRKSFFKVLKRH
ncbi:hypothetical protein NEISICOT_03604 [Neisseria sicca ATCC 29256]|uniref:Uncharacterized protein n=1 Tax=Neisseria sicca ATCC 29256 TaxID=547045 RepID=C6MAM2_NEISI|nr:hypothetical protein NEISICOT_03604 [Neisseria sicca ATCC 29256]